MCAICTARHFIYLCWGLGQGEIKHRALPQFRFGPDPATVVLHHFLANGQTNASAGVVIPTVGALENGEQAGGELWINADAIIAHGKEPLIAGATDCNLHPRRSSTVEL